MERILLNLIPKGSKPVCHASQFDKGREVEVDLFEDTKAYILKEGDTVSLKVLKTDGIEVTANVPVVVGANYVIITVTEDMSDLVGTNLCELRVINGETDIGSSNFYMEIEKGVGGSSPTPRREGGLYATEIQVTSTTYETL